MRTGTRTEQRILKIDASGPHKDIDYYKMVSFWICGTTDPGGGFIRIQQSPPAYGPGISYIKTSSKLQISWRWSFSVCNKLHVFVNVTWTHGVDKMTAKALGLSHSLELLSEPSPFHWKEVINWDWTDTAFQIMCGIAMPIRYARTAEHGAWCEVVHWEACDEWNSWHHLSCTDMDERQMIYHCYLTSKLSCTHPNCCFAAIITDESHFVSPNTQFSNPVSYFWLEITQEYLVTSCPLYRNGEMIVPCPFSLQSKQFSLS